MMRWLAVLAVGVAGCNRAPLDYRDIIAPGAKAPWAGPTDDACLDLGGPSVEIDGFLLCGGDEGLEKIPVDDPILVPCSEARPAQAEVVSVFDGLRARAYPTDLLQGRELLHDDWGDDPLLIDF